MANEVHFAKFESIPNDVCWEDHFMGYISSNRTFCAGSLKDKKIACNGDSGKYI